jgi:hypothetical protein
MEGEMEKFPEVKRRRRNENGQVFIEAILWITLLTGAAVGFLKLSALDYRHYRTLLRNHESRAGGGPHPFPFSSRSGRIGEAVKKGGSVGW